jgi:CubicO group peptidase (beta-lactamase class C family)
MKTKTIILSAFLVLLTSGIGYGIYYCTISFPIISGYGAKIMCSSIFVSNRTEEDIKKNELGAFPLNLATFTIDRKDSSVTATVFGFASKKAIYRPGLGATLVSELSEKEIREQKFRILPPPLVKTDTLLWPLGDKLPAAPSNIDQSQVQLAVKNAFEEKDPKNLVHTRAVVVVYDGQLIYEQYAPGYNQDSKLIGWSMAKSITSCLIGMLVKDGKIDINNPAPVEEWKNPGDPRNKITIKDILQQSSGLDFLEDYSGSSDATKMLFQKANAGAYTASRPLKHKPSSFFYYSSGNSNILSRIIRNTIGDTEYHNFPYQRLFYKLGMYHTTLEPDASGTFVGSSFIYATARDFARFGLLYLNDGVYNNERLLPEGWVKESAIVAPSATLGQYGYQFWLNAGPKNDSKQRKFPAAPTEMFYADGFEGQHIFIIPSKKLVVVRLGFAPADNFDADTLLAGILQAIP